jgi:hypothetical protein
MELVKITHRDSCKTYALKRVGLSHIIDMNNDTPTLKDVWESALFEEIRTPEVGCLLIWKYSKGDDGYYSPHEIDESGRIIYVKRFDYGHIGVFESGNMVSDVSWEEGWGAMIRLRKYTDLTMPNIILKLKTTNVS